MRDSKFQPNGSNLWEITHIKRKEITERKTWIWKQQIKDYEKYLSLLSWRIQCQSSEVTSYKEIPKYKLFSYSLEDKAYFQGEGIDRIPRWSSKA